MIIKHNNPFIQRVKYYLLSSGIGILLVKLGSMEASVFAIASSSAELLEVAMDGDPPGRGTSPGVTSALNAALQWQIMFLWLLQQSQ